jgi:hypothetical protein
LAIARPQSFNAGLTIPAAFSLLPQQVAKAMAAAIAADGDQSEGLAKATASAICTGGATSSAFAEAWAETIKIAPNGCKTLVRAHAFALAQCKNGVATAVAGSEVLTKVLGGCNIPTQVTETVARATATATANVGDIFGP